MNSPDFSNYKVLIAEDDLINYKHIESVLKKTQIEIIHAKNGEKAVSLFNQNPNIDLVIMDVMMPVMNGFDATEKIKAKQPAVPVIFLTAFVTQDSIRQAVASGCNDYLSKPIRQDVLITVMCKWLPGK